MLTSEMVAFHRMLANDHPRMSAYQAAIAEVVRPGDVVLDIGTGSGILAVFACQAGAARVYAVDKSGILPVARQLAEANGLQERITFLHGDLRAVAIPEPVDVIVSELISRGGIGQRAEELVSEARAQYLKPGGRVVPSGLRMFVAPVEAPEQYQALRFPGQAAHGIDFSLLSDLSLNQPASTRMQPEQLLGPGVPLFEVDYLQVAPVHSHRADVALAVSRPGLLHGFVVWFEAELSPGIQLSNAPPGLSAWTNAFFPLPRPLPVREDTAVGLHWRALHPPGAGTHWQWNTTVSYPDAKGTGAPDDIRFRQTSLAGGW